MDYERRAFFRRKVERSDGTLDEGTYGGIQWNRCLTFFEGFSTQNADGQDPFEDDEQQEQEEADGEFVGYLPDHMEKLVSRARKAYEELYQQHVSHHPLLSHNGYIG